MQEWLDCVARLKPIRTHKTGAQVVRELRGN
jgi:hypothetical protein